MSNDLANQLHSATALDEYVRAQQQRAQQQADREAEQARRAEAAKEAERLATERKALERDAAHQAQLAIQRQQHEREMAEKRMRADVESRMVAVRAEIATAIDRADVDLLIDAAGRVAVLERAAQALDANTNRR